MNYSACSAKLTLLKKESETLWLQEVDSIALQSALRNLSDSFNRFFKKQNKTPRFKSKRNPVQSYTTKQTNGNIAVVGNKLKLPKLGLVKFAKSKEVDGRIMSATIRRNPSGNYYVSILVETDSDLLPKTGSACGIDVGLKDFAVVSDESVYRTRGFSTNWSESSLRNKKFFPGEQGRPKRMGKNCPNRKITRNSASKSQKSMNESVTQEPITCKRFRLKSSKTTTSSASKICRCPAC